MDVINDTPFEYALTLGRGPDQQPGITVIVKATCKIPEQAGEAVMLASEQLPVATEVIYHRGDSSGSIRTEADTVPYKPYADIVLAGTAYAPGGRPATSVDVALRVGTVRKVIRVFGDRQWLFPSRLVLVPVISEPEPFTQMPLIYERAFGGIDRTAGTFCHQNHVGRGFIGEKDKDSVNNVYLPNLEDPTDLITSWDDAPPPAGFGCISPTWQPRSNFAGTEDGLAAPDGIFGVPGDFQPAFHNSAHPDLQVPGYLRGDEEVELMNVTPDGYRKFRLPGLRPRVQMEIYDEPPQWDAIALRLEEQPALEMEHLLPALQEAQPEPVLDTLVFLPDEGVFYQVWRARYPVEDVHTEADLETVFDRVARLEVRRSNG
jgi:hypothetical protein